MITKQEIKETLESLDPVKEIPIKSVSDFRRQLRLSSRWQVTNTLTGTQHMKEVVRKGNGFIIFKDRLYGYTTRLNYPSASQCKFSLQGVHVYWENQTHSKRQHCFMYKRIK